MTSRHELNTHVPAAASMPCLQSGQAFVGPHPFDRISVDVERPGDAEARELLLDRAFGPARAAKTCERLRAGRLPARGLSLVARTAGSGGGAVVGGQFMLGSRPDAADNAILGTVRLWHVDAGGVAALMLGPLAVEASARCLGVGARLMEEAIARARALGHDAIVLVGDAPYYARFGFERRHTLGLHMPGPVEAARFLGLELMDGALAAAKGLVRPTGAADLAARRLGHRRTRSRRAA